MGKQQVSGTRSIAAAPEEIFDILADHTRHPELDGSGTVRGSRRTTHERLELGSTFAMDMKMGASYKILNTVVEFEENRLIAWRHHYGHRWRWQLTPQPDGTTEVTETFDWSTAKHPWLIPLIRAPKRNKRSIEKTLDKLQQRFASRNDSLRRLMSSCGLPLYTEALPGDWASQTTVPYSTEVLGISLVLCGAFKELIFARG